jgi:outer membrane protein OmpA-like peptidoglycan-associated protein
MNDSLHDRRELRHLRRISAGRILLAAAALCSGCAQQTPPITPETPPTPAAVQPQPQQAPAPVRPQAPTQAPPEPARHQAPAEVRDPERIPVVSVSFEAQSDQIDPHFVSGLRGVADNVKADPRLWVILEGYTNARGSREFNMALAQRRAAKVQQHLVELGVKPNRIRISCYGEERSGSETHADRVDVLLRRSAR